MIEDLIGRLPPWQYVFIGGCLLACLLRKSGSGHGGGTGWFDDCDGDGGD